MWRLFCHCLTHCRLYRLSHTIYWKSPISILGTAGYEIHIFTYSHILHIPKEKWLNYLQTVETLIRCRVLRHLIWGCTVCQLPFYRSPDYNGLIIPSFDTLGRLCFMTVAFPGYLHLYFDILCELSAWQMIHMKCQTFIFSET